MMLYSENITTLVMIDNRKVYSYAFGGTFWESLAIEIIDIERIELIKGSSGALYGSNAVSGVINIITKKIKNKKLNVNANLQAGNFNSKIAEFSISKGLNEKKILEYQEIINISKEHKKKFIFGLMMNIYIMVL